MLAPFVPGADRFLRRPAPVLRWRVLLPGSYLAALAWIISLAVVGGWQPLHHATGDLADYLSDVGRVGNDPLNYLRHYADATDRSAAAVGHPPGPVLLLWLLHRVAPTTPTALTLLLAAVGALLTPLVGYAMRSVTGNTQARRHLPVLVLAPYAAQVATSMDTVAAVLGAAMMVVGVAASDRHRRGVPAATLAFGCGLLLGVAAQFAYAVAWLGVSVVCLYFARRRPFLNLATAAGTLLPVLGVNLLGFGWLHGLTGAGRDWAARLHPHRPLLWWLLLSLVVLLLTAGPPLVASARKLRNTAGWPFLVGAGTAVSFSLVTGLARGGAEQSWLPFLPWLTVAAVAPRSQGGRAVPVPALLVAVGAATAIVLRAALRPD